MTIAHNSFALLSDSKKTDYCRNVIKKVQAVGLAKIPNMCAYISANLYQPYYWFVRNLRITDTARSYTSMQAQIAKVSKVL